MSSAYNIGVCAKDLIGDLSDNITWLEQEGFDSLQVWKQQIDQSTLSTKEFKSKIDDLGLSISAVGGGPNLVDKNVAKESRQSFYQFIDLACELSCDIVSAESKILPQGNSREEGWDICLENLSKICDYAKSHQVYIAIECAGPCFIRDHHDWHELNQKLNNPMLKVNFDAANILWGRKDPLEACKALIEHTVHTHIKNIRFLPDLNEMKDEELQDCPLAEGLVDYLPIIKILQDVYRGAYCIEMHSGHLDRKEDILKSKEQLLSYLMKMSS